jgi:tRNA threonylcarbamoyladenosine biosynthesis protein TsaB
MMWVLAVDTSSPAGAVALLRDSEVIADRQGDPARSHIERLPQAVADVLAEAGLSPRGVDLFAVAAGPGAFTALRVGLATIQGLALALDRPTVGVSSLAATAWRHFQEETGCEQCGVWLDGARGDVFAAAFARPVPSGALWPLADIATATVAAPSEVAAAWHGVLAADAPILLGPRAPGHAAAAAAGRLVIADERPLAVPVARIGGLVHQAGHSGPPHALAPLYVRRPDAEVERERRRSVAPPAW